MGQETFWNKFGSAIVTGVGAVGSAISQGGMNKKNREFAKEQSEVAYAYDQDMWNKKNAYDTPAEQMKRLKKAGLNPNLVYGTGSATQASGQIPKYSVAKHTSQAIPTPDVMSELNKYHDTKMKKAQINNVEANTIATNQKATNDAITNDILTARAGQEGIKLNYAEVMAQYNLQGKQLGNQNTKLRNDHQQELNRLLIIEGINPNDPAWYRDFKKSDSWETFKKYFENPKQEAPFKVKNKFKN